jgi:hypothetical protein
MASYCIPFRVSQCKGHKIQEPEADPETPGRETTRKCHAGELGNVRI